MASAGLQQPKARPDNGQQALTRHPHQDASQPGRWRRGLGFDGLPLFLAVIVADVPIELGGHVRGSFLLCILPVHGTSYRIAALDGLASFVLRPIRMPWIHRPCLPDSFYLNHSARLNTNSTIISGSPLIVIPALCGCRPLSVKPHFWATRTMRTLPVQVPVRTSARPISRKR